MVLSFKLISTFDISLPRYVFQFLLVFFPKVADQVLTEQVEKHDLRIKMAMMMIKMMVETSETVTKIKMKKTRSGEAVDPPALQKLDRSCSRLRPIQTEPGLSVKTC